MEDAPAAVNDRGAGQQEQVAAERLGALLDADQEGVVEVAVAAGEHRLVGEHPDDAVVLGRQPARDRVGDVAGLLDRPQYPVTGLRRDPHVGVGPSIEDQ